MSVYVKFIAPLSILILCSLVNSIIFVDWLRFYFYCFRLFLMHDQTILLGCYYLMASCRVDEHGCFILGGGGFYLIWPM